MPKKLTDGQMGALAEMRQRGMLKGEQAGAADELIRRWRAKKEGGGQEAPRSAGLGGAHEAIQQGFANAATLGLAGPVQDAVSAGARAIGLGGETRDERQTREAQTAAEHPVASAAGTVGGAVAGGAGLGGAAARMGVRPAKSVAGRAGQYAAGGAGAGAVEQVAREGEVGENTAISAGVGAVAGGVGGVGAEKALGAAAPKLSRAWRKLAGKLQTPVDDMAAFLNDTKAATGVTPSVAQAVHARDQGVLKGWAQRHNTLGTEFDEAARRAPGEDLSAGRLRRQQSDLMDEAMESPRASRSDTPAEGTALAADSAPSVRDSPVNLSQDVLESPHVHDALRGPKMKDIRIKIGEGDPLTVGDVDRIRQKLRGMQKSEPGGPFGDFADQLRDETVQQVPEYGAALDRYSRQSKFIAGFDEGKAGRSMPEVEDKVTTPEGRAGHDAGARTNQGQRALRTMAPRVPTAEGDTLVRDEFSRGAAHASIGGGPLGMFHIWRGVKNHMDSLSEKQQKELAEGLLARDPDRVRATLGRLRKAGTDLQSIRQLSTGLSALMGAEASQAASEAE